MYMCVCVHACFGELMVVVQISQSGLIAWPGVKRVTGYGSPTFS